MGIKSFYNWQTNGGTVDIQKISRCLDFERIKWCAIDNVAVNHWATYRIITNEFNFIVLPNKISTAIKIISNEGFKTHFTDAYYLIAGYSDLCIKLLTDKYYDKFLNRAIKIPYCYFPLRVSCLEDTFNGIIYSYFNYFKFATSANIYNCLKFSSDQLSKLQNITRLIERYPKLKKKLPKELLFILNKLK